MKNSTTKSWVISVMVLGMIALIILNPISKYSQWLTANLNNFFEMCKIGYNFSENDTVTIIRLFRNSPIIMFVGLFIAVLEALFRRLCIEDALISFIWIFIAMIFYIVFSHFGSASSKKSNSKYKIKKYDRRR